MRPRVKRQLIALGVAAIVVSVGVSVVVDAILRTGVARHTPAGERFEARLKPLLARGEVTVPLRSLTDFAWSEVCSSRPYGGAEFRNSLGDRFPDAVPWSASDAFWGLVFLDDDATITTLSIARDVVEYTSVPFVDKCLCGDVALRLSPVTMGEPPWRNTLVLTGEPCQSKNTLGLLKWRLERIAEERGFVFGMDVKHIETLHTQLDLEEQRIIERIGVIEAAQ